MSLTLTLSCSSYQKNHNNKNRIAFLCLSFEGITKGKLQIIANIPLFSAILLENPWNSVFFMNNHPSHEKSP